MRYAKTLLPCSLLIALSAISQQILAHAEHDKARYVATDGVDQGRCDNPKNPCQSIRYAAQYANKGDNIRLASGNYQIEDADTLFYLLSDLVPIRGVSQSKDQPANQTQQITRLSGVPLEFAETLAAKGFTIIVDAKGRSAAQSIEINAKLTSYHKLQQAKSRINCIDGFADDHPCRNIDLIAHVPLSSFGSNQRAGNDIWGHYDLNDGREYALIGLSNGVSVIDVTDASTPRIVGTITSQNTIWRDLKVYQKYHASEQRWQSYAYVTADNASAGLMIIDLTELPEKISLAATDTTDISAHNVYLSNVDYSTGVALNGKQPYLHVFGSNNAGGAFNSYGLSNPTKLKSVYDANGKTRANYTHDASSMVIDDARKDSQCVNGISHCEIFFDFNEQEFLLWDKTNNASPAQLSTTTYNNAAYVHSGWYTEDKMIALVHDELDEQRFGLNTTLRLFDISDLTNPTPLSTWTGPTSAIDHNGYVRGNRYYMSNYERGLTVLDISDPQAPTEVGYFDTFPISDNAAFNGAWGVYPFLPSGNILISDVNSGLYILKDNTLSSANGSLSFAQSSYAVNEGDSLTINVERLGSTAQNIVVGWEIDSGSGNRADISNHKGELTWLAGDNTPKSIILDIVSDEQAEGDELLIVRLIDPRNGATLSAPHIAMITIAANGGNQAPTVDAGEEQTAVAGSTVTLSGRAVDADGDAITVVWQQLTGPSVTLNNKETLTASFTAPSMASSLTFSLTATDSNNFATTDEVTVNITAPTTSTPPKTTQNGSSGGGISICGLLAMLMIMRQRKN